MTKVAGLFDRLRDGQSAPDLAPIPQDPLERANHLKAASYYLDASMAAVARVPESAILDNPVRVQLLDDSGEVHYSAGASENKMAQSSVAEGEAVWANLGDDGYSKSQAHALVLLVEYTQDPKAGEPGATWIQGSQAARAAVRVGEVAAVLAQYLRFLGYEAKAHTTTATDLDFDVMLLASGLGEVKGTNGSTRVVNPYLGSRFGMAVISTNLDMAVDQPLAKRGPADQWKSHGPGYLLGAGGTKPGWRALDGQNRPLHLGRYPMEKIKRVDVPTTYIDTPNVPRVPKRAEMFLRAAHGDLGKKSQKQLEGFRMITKSPFGHAMMPVLGGMVPLQYGEETESVDESALNPTKNANDVKAACYYMGADMTGICEIPEYAWYSLDHDASEIEPYHKYAIAVLVDQGYDTMEGASGDDWISGAQSMRAYMRSGLVTDVVAEQIRRLGYSARTHTVLDQDVLHIPLILQAGLGEMSRIGELVLNPLVGPRFKSAIITTNMPMTVDQPIDFGLQDFCGKCQKCARECPCTAIPFGDKIMFNGYEIWKPDTEKCARYRITNSAGSMCGRCMKTCPYNLEGVLAERPFLWAARNLPFTREWIANFDDKVGNGRINPIKTWWWDLDTDDDGKIVEARRKNERQLAFRDPLTPEQQMLACYPVEDLPTPVIEGPQPPDRKLGMVRYQEAVTPQQYRATRLRERNMDPAQIIPSVEVETSAEETVDAQHVMVKIASKTVAAQDIMSFELVDPDGGDLPTFTAGSHIDVHVSDIIIRQYSLCNDPAERHRYVLGVLKEPQSRGGSIAMHEAVAAGDIIKISVPRNTFHLKEQERYSVLLAGGIGVTPILSMARRLWSLGRDFEFHYCSRSEGRMAFYEALGNEPFAERIHFHFDDQPKEQLLDIEGIMSRYQEGHNLYVCGPKGFMDFVTGAADDSEWPNTAIHREYFVADPMAGHLDDAKAFTVKLASTGKSYEVGANQTIVEALAKNGIDIPISCEQGICGTCLTGVLEGEPDHRDTVQNDQDKARNKQMTLCCSRAKGDLLVLDL
jgi:reductive dehalogenase